MAAVCRFSLCVVFFFFFNDTATTEIYTLSLHDALPIYHAPRAAVPRAASPPCWRPRARSEEHTSELQSPYVISYAVFCLKKKNNTTANKSREHTKSDDHTPTHCRLN